jgi:hypothetical protein
MTAKPVKTIELLTSPEGYFQELVQKGLSSRKIQTYPFVESYLVSLLQHYLDSRNLFEEPTDGAERTPQTLAEMYLIAQNSEPIQKVEMLKKLGDRTLYISGFFGDSLSHKIVDVDYYAQIGGSAYASLAHCTREDTLAKVFHVFSSRFMDFVDVLTFISHHSFIKSDQSILRLYDRYLRTGSELAKDKLIEMGVLTIPVQPSRSGQKS